jgi:hypothetical protein
LFGGRGPDIITPLRPPEPFVTPFLSFLGAAALLAAPVESSAPARSAHYQKVADGLTWKDPEKQSSPSFEDQLPGYQAEAVKDASDPLDRTTIYVRAGGRERCSWVERGDFAYFGRADVLYRADYQWTSSGCTVVAFDLKAGKELWKASLKGLGPVDHSKYSNRVWMERLDDAVFAVYGKESAGRYVELVDFKTGQTVGHKVYPRD